MTCKDCRYRASDSTCRRFPPTSRPTCWPTVLDFDWCGEFHAMNSIPPTPPTPPPQPSVTTSISMMQQLEEGVAPVKPKFNKRNTGTLKEIQETPIFGGEHS